VKIVVTGAIGHIGSYVIRDLAIQFPGAEIVMIDNMMTQRFPSLFNLPALGCYRFIEADVTRIDLRPLLKDAHVLIHLAAITDAAGSFDKADLLEANNYQSTVKVAEACAVTFPRKIVFQG
jgi:UDP-glucose 4-epimerase